MPRAGSGNGPNLIVRQCPVSSGCLFSHLEYDLAGGKKVIFRHCPPLVCIFFLQENHTFIYPFSKFQKWKSSKEMASCGSAVMEPRNVHEVAGWIPGLAECFKDP